MTEQEKRKKVIKGLECCATNRLRREDCEAMDCTYLDLEGHGCIHQLIRDALALLKAQEPRVMTLEEAKNAYVVEYRSGNIREIGSALLDLNVDPLNAEYGKIYRVWTSRPTDEQRETVKWE